MDEATFQRQVIELAHILGWQVMHVRRSMGRRQGGPAWQTVTSIHGWPDLFCWHPASGQILVAELKSDKGRLRPEQKVVLEELALCGLDVRVWRPKDWDEVQAALQRTEPERARVSPSASAHPSG